MRGHRFCRQDTFSLAMEPNEFEASTLPAHVLLKHESEVGNEVMQTTF
jgi:hypothetical protein